MVAIGCNDKDLNSDVSGGDYSKKFGVNSPGSSQSYRGIIGADSSSVINVLFVDGKYSIDRQNVISESSDSAFVIAHDFTEFFTSNGAYSIPNDGQSYWFISADQNVEPVRLAAGSSGIIGCPCPSGSTSGSCAMSQDNCIVTCHEFNCTVPGCKPTFMGDTPDPRRGTGIIVVGNIITVDGVEYWSRSLAANDNFSSTTYRSMSNSSVSFVLTREANGSDVSIVVDTLTNEVAEANHIFAYDVVLNENNNSSFKIPQDGEKYWFIPIDNSTAPILLTNGQYITYICLCMDGAGVCDPVLGPDCRATCKNTSCTGTCCLEEVVVSLVGSGVVIKAERIQKDGAWYN